MQTEYLREFITLARRLNFTAAANDLCMAQPTLSRHIADLEKHFGTTLIRRGEPLALTYAGECLFDAATDLLAREEVLEATLAEAKNVSFTELRIQDWRYSHDAMALIRNAAAELSRSIPSLRVRFVNVEQGTDIPAAVLSGRLDIGVLAHTTEGEGEITECAGVATLPLTAARSRLHFFIGPRSSLAGRESISIQDLRGQTIIVPLIPECTNIRGDLTCLCEARGFTPQFMATTLSSIDDLFCMDLGAGLLIGISEYFDRGFANSGISMACCTDEVYVTSYLLYPSQGDDTDRRFIEAVRTANAAANSR